MAEIDTDAAEGAGSPARVAYDLYKYLRNAESAKRKEQLDQYAECLEAVRGQRKVA